VSPDVEARSEASAAADFVPTTIARLVGGSEEFHSRKPPVYKEIIGNMDDMKLGSWGDELACDRLAAAVSPRFVKNSFP
jgi:hypothetical protein